MADDDNPHHDEAVEAYHRAGGRADQVPVTYRNADGEELPLTLIRQPDGRETEVYMDQNRRVCMECQHFDWRSGQKELVRQRFAERLVREEGWQLHHLGAPIEYVGLCGAAGGETATTTISLACDQFREHAVTRRRRSTRWK